MPEETALPRPGLSMGRLLWSALLLCSIAPALMTGPRLAAQRSRTVTLYVIDFDNLAGDSNLDWLSKALKDMILLR
ncbi:MAG: hypothetical protein IIB43_10520, partial [Candidatus Marinimicrobia bacterium]|nr:hypothetical protein [Candidatus Neomarinimicrobiota bacterium]